MMDTPSLDLASAEFYLSAARIAYEAGDDVLYRASIKLMNVALLIPDVPPTRKG
jgi:hypothetical protein